MKRCVIPKMMEMIWMTGAVTMRAMNRESDLAGLFCGPMNEMRYLV
jgi:hypothetical protein